MIDLLLINPGNLKKQFGNVSNYATIAQPLGITMIAAYIRENSNYTVKIIDAEVEMLSPLEVSEIVKDLNPRVIGITAFTTKMTSAIEIIRSIRKLNIDSIITIGGHHPSAIPEETLKETKVDYVIIGEGYNPILDILNGKNVKNILGIMYFNGEKYINNGRSNLINLDELPIPAWDLLPMEKYRAHHWQTWNIGKPNSFAVIFSSLGCPYNCNFCSVNVVYGKRNVRFLTPERFVENIEFLVENYGIQHFEIIDDTFTLNKKRVRKICDLLIQKKLNIDAWCFGRTDRVDKGTLNKMVDAGINWVFLGLEAANNDTLKNVFKNQTQDVIYSATETIRNTGINLGGNFIFGIGNDTVLSMKETLNMALTIVPDWANFFIPMAYPGTEMYNNNLGTNNLPSSWNGYGFFSKDSKPLSNINLTSDEILVFRDKAFNLFYNSNQYKSHIIAKFGMAVWKDIEKMANNILERG